MNCRNTSGQRLRDAGQRPNLQRSVAAREPPERPLRRFRPANGMKLTLAAIRGPWRPSGTVAGAGVFAVTWASRTMNCWAALHDFSQDAQLRLIEECSWLDRAAGGHHGGDWEY